MKAVLSPMMNAYKEVVRVATSNNFNCTPDEFKQLDGFVAANPTRYFFVNCNIKTPKLLALNKHSYKAVITANPDLTVRENEILRLYDLDREVVAFVRVKYIPDSQPIIDLIQELSEAQYKVVITNQRFNGKKNLEKYSSKEHYKFDCNRYRLHGKSLEAVLTLADDTPGVYICDRTGLGCGGCGLCSTLTLGENLKLSSLNLSTSGVCAYDCPDCYAKQMQHFLVCMRQAPILYDVIKQNNKQAGRTTHIKNNAENLLKR
jgi:hypothetical protein